MRPFYFCSSSSEITRVISRVFSGTLAYLEIMYVSLMIENHSSHFFTSRHKFYIKIMLSHEVDVKEKNSDDEKGHYDTMDQCCTLYFFYYTIAAAFCNVELARYFLHPFRKFSRAVKEFLGFHNKDIRIYTYRRTNIFRTAIKLLP